MDFPKSVPNVGLVNGQFVDENTGTGLPGSLIPASWGNSVTKEILNVLSDAGVIPDELKLNQLSVSISAIASKVIAREAMPVGAGGLLARPEIVRGNLNAIPNTRFFALADDTGDRPPSVRYAAGMHISFPSGTALDSGIDFAGSVLGKSWFGGRRYFADGTGTWVTFWTSDDFDPANKADKATTLGGYGIVDAYTKTQADSAISTAISGKANKATTLGGYGIADAYTKTQADSAISTAASGKADKATTLSGYGITNAYTSAQVDSALADKFDKSGGRVNGAVKISIGGQSVAASGLTVTNADSGAAITSIKLETSLTAANLIHTSGTSGIAVRDAVGGYATVDAGDVLSRGSLCHTTTSFVKPFAAGWISLLGVSTLPAGGTWAYQMTIYNGNGQALESRTGVVAGGTAVGTTSSAGFAWKISN